MKSLRFIGIAALSYVGAFAADPAWYTDLSTQLTSINGMVVGTLGAVISISLAPLAWGFVRKVLHRG